MSRLFTLLRRKGGLPFEQLLPTPTEAYPTAMAANAATAMQTNGSANYASVPYAAVLNPGAALTVEWRGTLADTAGNNVLVELPHTTHTAPHYIYTLVARTTGYLRWDVSIGATRYEAQATVPEIKAGMRLHIAGTFDGAVSRVYVNGRLVKSTAAVGSINTVEKALYFGRHGNSTVEAYNPTFDEVRVWNTTRTAAQLVQNMDRQLTGAETGLVGLWLFNEGSGSVLADATANANNGAITGTVSWPASAFTWDGSTESKLHIPHTLNLTTYHPDHDGTVHPSVAYAPGGLGGYAYWMAVTPYAPDDIENPSIFASHDGVTWAIPDGLTNPIVPEPTPDVGDTSAYNSDCCLLLVKEKGVGARLWLYYRSITTPSNLERIWLTRSSDGVTWDAPAVVLTNAGDPVTVLSPSVWHTGTEFVMLTVDHPAVRRWTSNDGVTWTGGSTITVNGLPIGRLAWHLLGTPNRARNRVEILFVSSTDAGGVGGLVHYATTDDDGLTIDVHELLTNDLQHNESTMQYVGNFVADPTVVDRWWMYYSGKNTYWSSLLVMRRFVESGSDLRMLQENALP